MKKIIIARDYGLLGNAKFLMLDYDKPRDMTIGIFDSVEDARKHARMRNYTIMREQ